MKRIMKRWFRRSLCVVLALVISAGIVSALPETKADALIVMSAWPGSAMTPVKGHPGIYSFEVPPQYNMVIFSDGKKHELSEFEDPSKPACQTKDLSKFTGAVFNCDLRVVEGNSIGMKVCGGGWTPFYAPGATPNTVYCKPPAQWGTPSCYAWDYFNTMPEKPLDDEPKPYRPTKNPDNQDFDLVLDSGVHLTAPEDWALIGGKTLELDFGIPKYKYFRDNDTVRVYFASEWKKGEEEDESNSRNSANRYKDGKFHMQTIRKVAHDTVTNGYDGWDEYKNVKSGKGGKVGFDKELSLDFEGFFEGRFVNGKFQDGDGNINMSLTGGLSTEIQRLVGWVPVVIKFGASASLSGSSDLTFGKDRKTIIVEEVSATLPELTASVGVGITQIADLSAYGALDHSITKNMNVYTGAFGGEVGVSGKLLMFENKWPLWQGRYIYTRKAFPEVYEENPVPVKEETIDDFEKVDPEEIDERLKNPDQYNVNRPDEQRNSQFNGNGNNNGGNNPYDHNNGNQYRNLQKNVYASAAPKTLRTNSGKTLMTWNADISKRATGNHVAVVYSLLDPETGTWSDPKIVDDDGTADGQVDVATDGEDIYLVFTNMNGSVSAQDSVIDALDMGEIEVAKYDPDSDSFDCVTITDNDHMDIAPSIAVSDGEASVTWISGEGEEIFNGNVNNTVKYVTIDEQLHASNAVDIAQINGMVGNSVSGVIADKNVVVYTESDPASADYGDVFLCEPDKAASKIFDSENNTATYNLKYSTVNGENLFTFINGSTLYGYGADGVKALNAEEAPIIGDYAFISSDNKTYLVSVENAEDHNEAYLYNYSGGKWTNPVAVTDNKAYIKSIGGFVDESGDLRLNYQLMQTEIIANDVIENSSLITQTAKHTDDIELLGVDYDPNEYVRGARMPVKLLLKNNGTEAVNKVKSVVIDDENKVVGSASFSVNIASGETVETNLEIPTRNVNYPVNYKLFISSVNAEPDTDGVDFKNVALGYTDLTLISVPVMTEDERERGYCFFAKNNSKIGTEAMLIVTDAEDDGNKIAEFSLGTVAAGTEKKFFMDSAEVNKIKSKSNRVKFTLVAREGEHAVADNIETVDLTAFDQLVADNTKIKEFKNGDTDGDNVVDILDATYLQRYCSGITNDSVTEETMWNSDVNDDGEMDIIDVAFIQRYLASIATPYKVGEDMVTGLL